MSEMNRIPKRNEIAVEDTWAVEDLFASDELWEQELAAVSEEGKKLAAYAGRLGESGKTLYEYLEQEENTGVVVSRLANYCMRCHDVDTRNPKYQAMVGKFMSTMVAMRAASSFSTPEIMDISDETMEGFFASCFFDAFS